MSSIWPKLDQAFCSRRPAAQLGSFRETLSQLLDDGSDQILGDALSKFFLQVLETVDRDDSHERVAIFRQPFVDKILGEGARRQTGDLIDGFFKAGGCLQARGG